MSSSAALEVATMQAVDGALGSDDRRHRGRQALPDGRELRGGSALRDHGPDDLGGGAGRCAPGAPLPARRGPGFRPPSLLDRVLGNRFGHSSRGLGQRLHVGANRGVHGLPDDRARRPGCGRWGQPRMASCASTIRDGRDFWRTWHRGVRARVRPSAARDAAGRRVPGAVWRHDRQGHASRPGADLRGSPADGTSDP